MTDAIKLLELKNQLKMLVDELDNYSADPFTLEFKDKTIDASLYDHPENIDLYSKASGRDIHVNDDEKVCGYYYNAIQELGAFLAKSVSRNVDYVVLNKNPEGTVRRISLEFYVWHIYESQGGNYFDWIKQFRANKEEYNVERYQFYVEEYTKLLEAIKKASEGRTKKKKNPQPPVYVIWEDQIYKYLVEKDAFDKELLKCNLMIDKVNGGSFERMKPFIKDGKSVEFLIRLKKGTQEELDNALEWLTGLKNNLDDVAVTERGPKAEDNNAILRVRSNKSDMENLLNDFIAESDSEKLDRAVKMFAASVEMVERSLDLTNDYNNPTVKYGSFRGKRVVGPEKYNKVTEFLDAIKAWMGSHDMNYDYDSKPGEITDCIKMYFDQAVSSDRGWADIDGLVGVRIPIGIIVAYLNYASPFSDIQFEFAHDKWEYRGDYSTGKLVSVRFKRFDEMPEIDYCYYEERDM